MHMPLPLACIVAAVTRGSPTTGTARGRAARACHAIDAPARSARSLARVLRAAAAVTAGCWVLVALPERDATGVVLLRISAGAAYVCALACEFMSACVDIMCARVSVFMFL